MLRSLVSAVFMRGSS